METLCVPRGWEVLMEFRLSDSGRPMEAAVGRRAEDVMDGQSGGGYIFDLVCAHMPCCHQIDSFSYFFFLKGKKKKSSFMELWLS